MNNKILLLGTVASSFYGFRLDLIKELIVRGYEVYAFTSESTAEDLEKIRSLGVIPITYNLKRSGLNPLLDIKSIVQIAFKMRELKPDLVLSFFSKPVIYGTFAAKIAHVSNIVGMLEGLGYSFTDPPDGPTIKLKLIRQIQIFLYKLSLPLLDTIIFLNPDDPKDLLNKYDIKVKNVEILGGIGLNLYDYPYQPIDCQDFKSIRFLFIGRLLKEKGIYDFLSAAKIVKLRYPNVVFTILGAADNMDLGGISKDKLDNYIQEGLIEYPGHVSNVVEWIEKSHVFVLPSYYREGVPRSIQEAMAIGRAIITTDVPGCRETVEDCINGFLVPKWSPEILAEKMVYFIENPEKISIMGQESYKIAKEKFDACKVNERLLKIIGL